MGFFDLPMKWHILDLLWEQPMLNVQGEELTFYSDLTPITLWQRSEWRSLTNRLTKQEIPYKWGFPFRLLIDYKGKTVMLKTILQAKEFEKILSGTEVEVENMMAGNQELVVRGLSLNMAWLNNLFKRRNIFDFI